MATKAPKQEKLTKTETINSFNAWKENLCYMLYLDDNFKPFFADGLIWGKKSAARPSRNFVDDADTVQNHQTKEQKCAHLDLMLGQVANYATVISRNQITRDSASFADVWNRIRGHYGFLVTGSRFLDLSSIKLEVGERPEDLYQRLLSFFEDNLQVRGSSVTHHGVAPTADEEISPTVENTTVLLWLERLHMGLPALVKQRYGSELRNKSLASLKPEISLALDSLLEETRATVDSKVCRTFGGRSRGPSNSRNTHRNYSNNDDRYDRGDRDRHSSHSSSGGGGKYSVICKNDKRPDWESHYVLQCKYLTSADRRNLSKVRNIEVCETDDGSMSDASISGDEDGYSGSGSDSEQHIVDEQEADNNSAIAR